MSLKLWNWGGFWLPYYWVIKNRAWNGSAVFVSFIWLILIPFYVTLSGIHGDGLLQSIFQESFNFLYDFAVYPKVPLLLDVAARVFIGINGNKWLLKNRQQIDENLRFGIEIPITALIYISPIFFLGTWF